MYIVALVFFSLTSAIEFIPKKLDINSIAQALMFCSARLCFGMFGNAIYMKKAVRAVNDASVMDNNAKLEYIKESGLIESLHAFAFSGC